MRERKRERGTKEKTPYYVREARTKDEFETDDLSPSRERRHEREKESERERETGGEEGREQRDESEPGETRGEKENKSETR